MAESRFLKRGRMRGKRFDPTDLKKIVREQRNWTAFGKVIRPEGVGPNEPHFDLDGTDLLVDVEFQPTLIDVTCRVSAGFGGPQLGLWAVPPVGAEVAVVIPDGELEHGPIVVGILSTGQLPDGVAANVVVFAGQEVLIHDGTGGAESLVRQSAYAVHTHPSGTGQTGIPNNAQTSGTVVLKGK